MTQKKAILPKKKPGQCYHPTCKAHAMHSPTASAIRCETHKTLCAHCWQRDYDPETGYCEVCWQAMLSNSGKFTVESTFAAAAPSERDLALLDDLERIPFGRYYGGKG